MEGISLVLQHSEELREIKSKMPQNANYLSPESQNELLHCMATMVQNQIVSKVHQAKFWSIIADETKDASKTEQISICIRYWDRATKKSCIRLRSQKNCIYE